MVWFLKFVFFLQVLHAAVMKQLEINDLLENMQQPKCRVSWSLYVFKYLYIRNILEEDDKLHESVIKPKK